MSHVQRTHKDTLPPFKFRSGTAVVYKGSQGTVLLPRERIAARLTPAGVLWNLVLINMNMLGHHVKAQAHTCIHTYIIDTNTYASTHTTNTNNTRKHTHTHTHILSHTQTYADTHINTHKHTHTHIHIHTYTYTYTHTHIHACTPTQSLNMVLVWGYWYGVATISRLLK